MNGLILTQNGLSALQERLRLMSDEEISDILKGSQTTITFHNFNFVCTHDSLVSLKDPRIMKIFFKNHSPEFLSIFCSFDRVLRYVHDDPFRLERDPKTPDWVHKNISDWRKLIIINGNKLTDIGSVIQDYLFNNLRLKIYKSSGKIEVIFTELQREMAPIYMMGHVTPDRILTKDRVNVLASYEVKNNFEMYQVIHQYITQ